MPELPEVETVRRGLEARTEGFQIVRVQVCRNRAIASPKDPLAFVAGLKHCSVHNWRRRGKYLLASLQQPNGEPGGHWGVHLRMTGQFLWLEEPMDPCPHTRVRFWNAEGSELRFQDVRSFGEMWWVPPEKELSSVIGGLKRLGPEPFSNEFTAEYLLRRLSGSRRSIKTALLDQSLVAGVGNIYADETLFKARLRPDLNSGDLLPTQLSNLREALLDVLAASIGVGGTTFSDFRDLTGRNGNYGGQAWVYRRGGQGCRICGTTIRRDRLAGRSTHWCPKCQS
ncbi:MAG: DNA-formamidopyrimidine glycosylase [Cyanobacteriota bacterium]|nr:DNA-formamidopyrimidine glycosylase [Cyanobacteriota bacterium]